MTGRVWALVAITWIVALPVLAETPQAANQAGATPAEEEVPALAPAPTDIHLLDEVPNYAEILKQQWSSGLPQDVTEIQQREEGYGLLGNVGQPQELSLAACIGLALQNNTNLQIQRLGPIGATAGVRQALSQFDPRVVGDLTYGRRVVPATTVLTSGNQSELFNLSLTANAGVQKLLLSGGQLSLDWTNQRTAANASIATPIVPLYQTTLGLSLNQPLLRDFGWRYSLLVVEVARNTEEVAYQNYAASIATIITQVEQAYWRLVLAIESVHVQEQSLALAKEVQRQNEGKFNVGTLPRTAVLEAKSEVAAREATLIQVRNAVENARDSLRAAINYKAPDAQALVLVEPSDKPAVPLYEINLQRSLKHAIEHRPELIAARLNIRGAGLQRKIAQNQLLPRLNFVGSIGVNGTSGTDAMVPNFSPPPDTLPINPTVKGGYGNALGQLYDGRFYQYAAGATLEIPLDNAQAKADYAQAKVGFEQARLSLRELEESVTLEIKQAVNNLQTDLRSIDATRIARELAEENLRNQQARYDVGLATTKDLLDFQDKLTLARFREIESLTRYNTDLAEMRRVEGSLLRERNILMERVSPEATPWWASF